GGTGRWVRWVRPTLNRTFFSSRAIPYSPITYGRTRLSPGGSSEKRSPPATNVTGSFTVNPTFDSVCASEPAMRWAFAPSVLGDTSLVLPASTTTMSRDWIATPASTPNDWLVTFPIADCPTTSTSPWWAVVEAGAGALCEGF